MQVVILCGGQGTRIRDVSSDVPKPMITIGDMPILWHIMRSYAHFGFTDFVLCLGYKSWTIKQFFLNYYLAQGDLSLNLMNPEEVHIHGCSEPHDWRVTLVETGVDAMTGCRVKRIEKYVRDDTFMLTYGDGVSNVDIAELVAFHRSHGRIGTVTAVRPPGRFGEIELHASRVMEFNEKPMVSRGWINGGFFVFDRRFFDRLDDTPELVLEQAPLIELARDGELAAFCHEGFWQPMDTSRDHRYLNDLWNSGTAPWLPTHIGRKRLSA